MITLCAATETEIAPTIALLKSEKLQVNILITGVGMMRAAFAITEHLFTQKPQVIVQAGLAGSLRSDLEAPATVVVRSESIGDAGVEENDEFRSVFAMGLEKDEHPWSGEKLVNPHSHLLDLTSLPQVSAVTVNEITTARNRIEYYRLQLGAEIETMEGAALHYCALRRQQPFLQLRAISNAIGERDKSKWKMDESVAILNKELLRIIKLLA